MKKKIFTLLCIVFYTAGNIYAQYTISGQIIPPKGYQTILLYQTIGAFQYYKASTPIDEKGHFGFALPEGFEIGNYRLVYDAQKNEYIDYIFNNENVSFYFDPSDVFESIHFYDSKENQLFFDYIKTINNKYGKLDSIQRQYYNFPNADLQKQYTNKLNEVGAYQTYFEKESEHLLSNTYIRNYKKQYPSTLLNSKEDYLLFLRKNFLNNIDFQDTVLRNSSFLIDRINEYVFDLNEYFSQSRKEDLDSKFIDIALSTIEKSKFKDEIIYSLTSSSFDPYNSKYDFLLNYIYHEYYVNLPEENKNQNFTDMVKEKLNVIIGKKAPNIVSEKDNLYNIKSKQTIVIFWSTSCGHCMKEIPEVYKLLENKSDMKVILIGLEEEYSDWENEVLKFPKWQNINAKGKWDHPYAKAYNIKGTPAYFVLDENKKIIAKPNKLTDLENLFKKD